jgi:murein DD-endopeptidase MepM/ murein hydrolase activator NlpD
MHPLNRAAAAAFVAFALGSRATSKAPAADFGGGEPASRRASSTLGLSAVCPPGSLPDGDVCLPFPTQGDVGGDDASAYGAAHHDKRGRYLTYEQIPRRPDRPVGYASYRYPLSVPKAEMLTMSGYDLDRPESEQRRGRKFSQVGHGGIDLAAPRGTEVRVVNLEHQEGDAAVLFAGKLFGTTVITRHTVKEGGRLRDYVVLYGHLDRAAPGVREGARQLAEGTVLGYVGDTGSEGVVHLHLEVRRVRDGIDVAKTPPERLVANEVSIVCDPRNVLPLE